MDRLLENPLAPLLRKLESHHPLNSDERDGIRKLPFKLRALEAQSYTIREGDRRIAVLSSSPAMRFAIK